MSEAGRYRVLEGIQGCGKTTIIAMIAGYYASRDIPVLVTKEPHGTGPGQRIWKEVLAKKAQGIHDPAYEMDQMFLARKILLPIVEQAVVNGIDAWSSRCYLSTENLQIREMGGDRMKYETLVSGLVRLPDEIYILDCEEQEAMDRMKRGGKWHAYRDISLDVLKARRQAYQEASLNPREGEKRILINANSPVDEVFHSIISRVQHI